MTKTFAFFFLLTILSSCFDSGIVTRNGFNFSNKAQFKIKDKCLNNDTSLIFLNQQYILQCSKSNWGCSGLEFFANGRVASFDYFKTPDSILHLAKSAGYYCLNNDEVLIEMSYDEPQGWTGSQFVTLRIKGKVFGDTLRFFEDKIKGRGKNIGAFTQSKFNKESCRTYIRNTKCVNLNKPDW